MNWVSYNGEAVLNNLGYREPLNHSPALPDKHHYVL